MTDDNVTFINKAGAIVPSTNEPNPLVIEALEEMLQKAKDGEIVGMAGAIMDKNKHAEFISVGVIGGFGMIGALVCVNHHLIRVARGEPDPPQI